MRTQQELLPQSVDETNPPLSDSLKKIKDITQNIERIDKTAVANSRPLGRG